MSNEFAALEDQVEDLLDRLERAERERDDFRLGWNAAKENWDYWAARAQKAEAALWEITRKTNEAVARAQKAEAVVEAARNVAGVRSGAWPELAAALTAYDEPPTEQG